MVCTGGCVGRWGRGGGQREKERQRELGFVLVAGEEKGAREGCRGRKE